MPLISCPDCGGSLSDRATTCVHCGAPIKPKCGLLTVFFYQKSTQFVLDDEIALTLCTELEEEIARFTVDTVVTLPVPRDMKVCTLADFPFPHSKGAAISVPADRHTYISLSVRDYAGNLITKTEYLGSQGL